MKPAAGMNEEPAEARFYWIIKRDKARFYDDEVIKILSAQKLNKNLEEIDWKKGKESYKRKKKERERQKEKETTREKSNQ